MEEAVFCHQGHSSPRERGHRARRVLRENEKVESETPVQKEGRVVFLLVPSKGRPLSSHGAAASPGSLSSEVPTAPFQEATAPASFIALPALPCLPEQAVCSLHTLLRSCLRIKHKIWVVSKIRSLSFF